MKFGRYLNENLTPEWKRAYIDYRGCKKAIKVIAARLGESKPKPPAEPHTEGDEDEHAEDSADSSDGGYDNGPSAAPKKVSSPTGAGSVGASAKSPASKRFPSPSVQRSASLRPTPTGYGSTSLSPRPIGSGRLPTIPPPLDLGESSYQDDSILTPARTTPATAPVVVEDTIQSPESSVGSKRPSSEEGMETSDSAQPLTSPRLNRIKQSPMIGKSPRFLQQSPKVPPSPKTGPSPHLGRRSLRSMTLPTPRTPSMRSARTFDELYDALEPDEQAFFDVLHRELDKVDSFFMAREKDAQRRANDLGEQLRELAEHRKIYHELYPNGRPEWEAKVGRIIPGGNGTASLASAAQKLRQRLPFTQEEADQHKNQNGLGDQKGNNGDASGSDTPNHAQNGSEREGNEAMKKRLRAEMAADTEHHTYNPERYRKYKRELRSATLEFYRQLELVKNYRILNLTGFRKALKKFEKTTKVFCMEMYTDEKISPKTFAKGQVIDDLIHETEDLFTEHFEHGDQKRARDKLRRQDHTKTHYMSVMRSGIYLGLGFPPAILALVKAGEEEQQALIPGWEGLLQIYGGFYIAVIFAMLFQLNLDAFNRARINYEFVMELSKPVLDHRSFAEIPCFLFMTLSYCFFFTFYRVSPHNVDPSTWPLAWLVFVCVFFLNPIDIFRRKSRFWFLRVLFRVCTPGYSKVEFIAFFLADELNSLVYTISNIYFIGCTYAHHWPSDIYTACPSGKSWPYALLMCLPAISRLIQCVKRWYDSKLGIHLINAGKYLSSIAQFCLFVFWKSKGRSLHDASFIVWVIIATASAVYTSAWDLIVDWSLLRPNARLLRKDRGYSSPYVYYFAMVTNVLIRFIWVWYIPSPQNGANTRGFAFALAEMLRRWQWNFFRVETEHLGNADAYRVTREIPLPYRRVEHDSEEDEDAKPAGRSGLSGRWDVLRKEVLGSRRAGRGPDELNMGPRGHERQREYEARRPGDTPEEARSEGEV